MNLKARLSIFILAAAVLNGCYTTKELTTKDLESKSSDKIINIYPRFDLVPYRFNNRSLVITEQGEKLGERYTLGSYRPHFEQRQISLDSGDEKVNIANWLWSAAVTGIVVSIVGQDHNALLFGGAGLFIAGGLGAIVAMPIAEFDYQDAIKQSNNQLRQSRSKQYKLNVFALNF